MSTTDDIWSTRLHAAVDDHPGATDFDVSSYLVAGRSRARRHRAAVVLGTVAVVAVVVALAAVAALGARGSAPRPADPVGPDLPSLGPATNGWVAVDASQGGGDIYLVRPGDEPRRLEVAGSEGADEACPAWSPDGSRLVLGRVTPSSATTSRDPEVVVVPIGRSGAAGTPTVIALDGFDVLAGFDPHPCGVWAPDGRWVAFAGTGDVWLVDTRTGTTRRLPDLRPSDLEWRPGTDELAIAGDMGTSRGAPTVSAPVRLYSVSTGELRELGSVRAAHLTWSPDGTTLAYTGGESHTAARELRLADADGGGDRVLVADVGEAVHGIGPAWSPTGDRIAYQRLDSRSGEGHEVVLVDVADGTESVLEPPTTGERAWHPFTVTWSPDGTSLLYAGWSTTGGRGSLPGGVVAVPADGSRDPTVLHGAIDPVPNYYSHRWTPTQMWGRDPG